MKSKYYTPEIEEFFVNNKLTDVNKRTDRIH